MVAERADLTVRNAKVTTLGDGGAVAEAVAVRGEWFAAVGGEAEVMRLAGEGTRVVDAGGRGVIPELNDSHLHAIRGGLHFNLELRWDGVGSLARGLQMIREQADRTPQGQWVRVMGGWSPYQFTERRMPTVAELNKVAPQVAPAGFATAQALLSFLDSDLRPARTRVTERLSHPALTGLTQHELHELTRRLAARQSAHAERLAYQRRGSPRQPGAQAGVFPQKISNSERVLLTILYHRGLCTLDVLASALSDVSRTAVGNGIRETLPLLQQEDHLPGQAPTRYRTAADLLAAGVPSGTPTS